MSESLLPNRCPLLAPQLLAGKVVGARLFGRHILLDAVLGERLSDRALYPHPRQSPRKAAVSTTGSTGDDSKGLVIGDANLDLLLGIVECSRNLRWMRLYGLLIWRFCCHLGEMGGQCWLYAAPIEEGLQCLLPETRADL